MKLIYYMTLIVWFVNTSTSQKFTQEQYPFPPHFKPPPNSGEFGSDSSIYLPPESHTTVPYFSLNNGNKLPYQFLPPTVTKVPSVYPTPFPMIMSSTMISRRNEDDDDEGEEEMTKKRVPTQNKTNFHMRNNQTTKNSEHTQDMRPSPKMFNILQTPIDRNDIKYPPSFQTVSPKTPVNQTPSSQRRMIISSELLKNDHTDQFKRASILGPQLIPSPIAYYSTTEPAIPILRLSNEMDLDGSFSYEALGADQTHYVQHSRMENSGTDKEEQVVEGSYSYVGDNGQTYTVHYVADSNGYRASGDHLPVPPPIPEIIQRAVQYNLAEEAKKPPHLRGWQDNEKEYENNESEKHRFSITPTRNLFTGRTPEAFSFGLTQTSILQNNLPAADNSQVPVKTNFDFSTDQSKGKNSNGPIAPQITFLASQGAHNPSVNSAQQQISRIFATEKPTLPQIMNYEASSAEPDLENNKALWRWQYGLNANPANDNQHPNKNSISRSSGEGDDVIINFNDMSPEQYTKLIKDGFIEQNTEISINQRESINAESYNAEPKLEISNNRRNEKKYINSIQEDQNTKSIDQNPNYKEIISPSLHKEQATNNIQYSTVSSKEPKNLEQDKLTSFDSNSYMNSSPLTTQSYEYLDTPYESTKLKTQDIHITTGSSSTFNDDYSKNDKNNFSTNNFESPIGKPNNAVSVTESGMVNNMNNIRFTDFIQKEEKNFKPIVSINLENETSKETTTEEPNPESIIRDNYFLKHLFKSESSYVNRKPENMDETITVAPQKPSNNKINLEPKFDKVPKFIPYQSKPQNEIKDIVKKPLDINDVLNYITFKNYFESNKLKSNNKFSNPDKFSQRLEKPQIFIPLENDREEDEQLDKQETQNLRTLNNQKQQELRGIIKNYKVLQRNNNSRNMEQNRNQFLTEASQRHLKTMQAHNLPPLGRAGPSMKSYLPPTYL